MTMNSLVATTTIIYGLLVNYLVTYVVSVISMVGLPEITYMDMVGYIKTKKDKNN